MRIHFVSFFGVDYDMDLLPWWSQWYLDRKLSSYTVFLHRFPKAVASDTKEWFRKLGFDVNIAPCEPFNDANLKRKTIGDFVATLPRDDYVIAPDDDEFQCMPGSNTPIDYSRECSRNDILMGCMIDRYAESRLLPECIENPFVQYSLEEPGFGKFVGNFAPPQFQHLRWPLERRQKLIAANACRKVDFNGSHVGTVSPDDRIAFNYRIVHFRWRKSMGEKMLSKAYYDRELCRAVGGFDDEKLDERQKNIITVEPMLV
jgi:hypothetical protein